MNKTAFIALIALGSFSFHGFAQTQLAEGYVITHNNDTVKGQIKFIDDNTNSKVCTFTDAATNQTVNYKPGEIVGYRFKDGNYYVSHQIKIDKDSLMVFLEFIVDGEIDLYYYGGEKYPIYFLQKPNENLLMITGGERVVKREDVSQDYDPRVYYREASYKIDNNQYKGALIYYMQDYPEIQKKAYTTDLNHKELTNLAVEYHEYKCTDKECIVYAKKESSRVKFSVGALGGLTFQSIYQERSSESVSFGASGILLGLQSDIFYGKNQAHMFSNLRLLYGTSVYSENDVKYDETFMGLGISINYKFLKHKFSPFAGLALELTQHNCHYDNLFSKAPLAKDYKKTVFFPKISCGLYWQASERIYVKGQFDYPLEFLSGESNTTETEYTSTTIMTPTVQINYLF